MDKKRLFSEFEQHLLEDKKPSEYFNQIVKSDEVSGLYPFTLLRDLIKVPQSPTHHPEGNVWNHTMLVVDNAAQKKHLSQDARVFMWAALLHDLGKAPTTRERKGKITSYDHDRVGMKLAIDFLSEFTRDEDFITKVSVLVRWHMQILFVVKDLPFADIEKMASQASVEEIALLSMCDRLGRGGMTKERHDEEQENIRVFLEKCREHLAKKKQGIGI